MSKEASTVLMKSTSSNRFETAAFGGAAAFESEHVIFVAPASRRLSGGRPRPPSRRAGAEAE